jgi:hypothetical protein
MIPEIPPLPIVPLTEECVIETAARFSLPEKLLWSILAVEGGKVGKFSTNKNGTIDLGPMQINSIWLDNFAEYVSASEVLYNGCVNVQVGAWILRSHINLAAGDFWKGVGNYHSKTPLLHQRYQEKIYAKSNEITIVSTK